MWKRREGKIFLALHACLLLLCLLFPLYVRLTDYTFSFLFGCFVHDHLSLYCAFCGGTRAFSALLHFQILDAIRYNVLVVGLVLWALVLDVSVFVRLLRNEKRLLKIPKYAWIVMLCALIGFMILRILLMIVWGIDPTGDLGDVWQSWKT
jgi:hypothetical protein